MSKRHVDVAVDIQRKMVVVCNTDLARPINEVVIYKLADAIQEQSLIKSRLATLLKTCKSPVNRLLDPSHDVTRLRLQRTTSLVGFQVQIELA